MHPLHGNHDKVPASGRPLDAIGMPPNVPHAEKLTCLSRAVPASPTCANRRGGGPPLPGSPGTAEELPGHSTAGGWPPACASNALADPPRLEGRLHGGHFWLGVCCLLMACPFVACLLGPASDWLFGWPLTSPASLTTAGSFSDANIPAGLASVLWA